MPITTIPFSARKAGPYMATAGQTEFSFAFPVLAAADLTVWRERAGVVTKLPLTTHYTVSGVGEQAGGAVVLTSGSLEDDIIAIDGTLAPARAAAFVGGVPFKTKFIDSDLNRLAIMVQELAREAGRAVRRAPIEEQSGSLLLPRNVTETSLLALTAAGEIVGRLPADLSLTAVSPFMAGLLGDANAAEARARLEIATEKVFSVKEYGALGDGDPANVVAETAAIHAAIADADAFTVANIPTITGFISAAVEFPAGNYLVSGITSTKPHRFFGAGKGATFLKLANGSNTSLWTHHIPGTIAGPTVNYFQQPIFQDMTWDCNKANQSGRSMGLNLPSTAWTIITNYGVGAFLDRMEIYNALTSNINIGANRNFGFIKDCTIKGAGDKGIANQAYDWRIYAIDIGSCLYGYSQDAAGGTTVWGSNIYLCTEAGVSIGAGVNTYLWFTSCSIDLNQKYGAIVNGNNDQETFQAVFDQCRFNGNGNLTDNTFADILATNCYGLAVTNSMFYAQGANRPQYAIQFSGGGPAFWSNNNYRTSGGTQPWVTALTNDFSKLQMAGDRDTLMTRESGGGFKMNKQLVIAGAADFFSALFAESTNASANPGPYQTWYRNSPSPAANDRLGVALFKGKDSSGNDCDYAYVEARIIDPTNGSEDGELVIGAVTGGAAGDKILIGDGVKLGAPTGGYKGAGTLNAAGGLFTNGISFLSGSGSPSGVVTAAKGSIYTNVIATTTTTRLFVNTDGGTTWTNLTAAA